MKGLFSGIMGLAVFGSVMAVQAESQFPLRLDVDVSTRRDSQNIGAGKDGSVKVEAVSLRVRIRRASGSPYTKPLKAEVYVIGRQIHTGYFGIIDVIEKDFNFSEERLFEFTTRQYRIGKTGGNINVGGAYETFLVVVTDEKGEVIETRSGRVIQDKGIEFIRAHGVNTLFDRDGNVVGEIPRQKDSAFKRAIPAATNPGAD